jgi:hypothetical protein
MTSTPPTPPVVPAPAPLSHDQISEIELGRRHARRIRRAATVASISGWSLAFFALVTLAGGVFGNWPDLAIGVALAAVAFNELKGAEHLRAFDPGAPKRLALGQVFLGVAVVAYAGWNWYVQSRRSPLAAYGGSTGSAEVDAMLVDITDSITPIVWGSVAVVGLLTCWLTAAYYASKSKTIRVFRERTPPWVIEVLAKAG